MRFTNKFPYTNINNINLDWIIKKVKEVVEQVVDFSNELADVLEIANNAQQSADNALAGIDDLTDYVNSKKAGVAVDSKNGEIVNFTPDATIPKLIEVVANIEPQQEGSGTPSTENIRPFLTKSAVTVNISFENLLAKTISEVKRLNPTVGTWDGNTILYRGISYTFIENDARIKEISISGTKTGGSSAASFNIGSVYFEKDVVYVFQGVTQQTAEQVVRMNIQGISSYYDGDTFIGDGQYHNIRLQSPSESYNNLVCAPALRVETNMETIYTAQLERAVRAGYLELSAGKLYTYPYYAHYNGEALSSNWLSSMDVFAEGATPTLGAQVVDLGGTPTVYDISPILIDVLPGNTNELWTDSGAVTVTYAADIKSYIDIRITELQALVLENGG